LFASANANVRNDSLIERARENRENCTLFRSVITNGDAVQQVLTMANERFWDEHHERFELEDSQELDESQRIVGGLGVARRSQSSVPNMGDLGIDPEREAKVRYSEPIRRGKGVLSAWDNNKLCTLYYPTSLWTQ
jgi:hypothetical protein